MFKYLVQLAVFDLGGYVLALKKLLGGGALLGVVF